MDTEKATVIAKIVGRLEKLKDQIEEVKDKEQDVFDEMTERQQESKKGEALQEMIDNLDTAYSDLDDAISVLEDYTEGIEYEEEEEQDEDAGADLNLKPQKPKETVSPDFTKNLKKNIEVMTNTFEANNLQCLGVGCRYYQDKKTSSLKVLVEMTTIKGPVKNQYMKLKINLYDDEDNLFATVYSYIDDDMSGFDTVEISCSGADEVLRKTVRGRLYVTR